MFTITGAFSGFSVDDIDAARTFYGETLGFAVVTNEMGFLELQLHNGAKILIYPKLTHTPASFTILNFPADDVEAAVDALNSRGVMTKIYPDDQQPSDSKGIVRGNGPDIAWFRDPVGNVLSVVSSR